MAHDEEQEEIAMHRRIKAAMRLWRENRRWNQEQMAQFLHITKINYQKYEYDNPDRPLTKVPVAVLMRFAEYTGIDVREITGPPRRRAKNG